MGDISSVLKDLDEDISYEALVDQLKQRYDTWALVEREPKSLEDAFKNAEGVELYARKVKPKGKDESKLKDLVEPDNLFQVYCDS